MPSRTSRTSAPTASHRLDTAFTKLSLVARKALDAYLIVSAVAASVTISGAWVDANSAPTRAAAARSSAPTTIRSGCRASWMAVPSRRNSGFDTTATSGRSRSCSTSRVEPTGTVDLLTTTAPCSRWGAISTATASRKLTSAAPSAPWGVGTHRNTNSAPRTASVAPVHEREPARVEPVAQDVAEAVLDDGGLAARQLLHLGGVRLAAHHLVPEMGQDDGGGQPDVAGTDHRRGHLVRARSRAGSPRLLRRRRGPVSRRRQQALQRRRASRGGAPSP